MLSLPVWYFSVYVRDAYDCNASVIWTFVCESNTTLSAGCPTGVTITPSTGTFEEDDVLTCSANGYDPTYSWTGTSGVTGATVSGTGDTYTLPEGPFYVICTATVNELPESCCASATITDTAYSKYRKRHSILLTLQMKSKTLPKVV